MFGYNEVIVIKFNFKTITKFYFVSTKKLLDKEERGEGVYIIHALEQNFYPIFKGAFLDTMG